MSKMRILMFTLAIGSAVGAAVLAKGMVGKKQPTKEEAAAPKIETTDVLVAAKDIEVGERLASGSVIWKPWPKNLVRDVMITRDEKPEAETELGESRALIQMYEGETVLDKKIVNPGEGGVLSALLPKGMRAYGITVRSRTSAGGFILPNDRVDVLLTRKIDSSGGSGGTIHKSETVITNARVLTINQVFKQSAESEETSVKDVEYASLELKPEQAEILARLESEGELSLALRSIAESDGNAVKEGPQLAEKYTGGTGGKPVSTDTLFVRFGIETYGATR
jgi:pilus assembly protein CpaB